MHNLKLQKFQFINDLNVNLIFKDTTNLSIIYRNYSQKIVEKKIVNLKEFCKKKGVKFYIANRIKECLKYDLDGILVASPANPTGSMLNKKSLKELINEALSNNVSFISDEIYHGIQYEEKPTTALEITNDCYVINSFSKYFSMTGWRVGWMIVPDNHIRQVERLSQNLFICPPNASQVTALAALDAKDELEENINVYKKNRKILLEELPKAGFKTFSPPDGAFYIYVDISEFSNDSFNFCNKILIEAGVAITPGLDFDQKRGNSTIRFSYARSTNDIIEGAKRIKEFMSKNYE